MLLATVAAPEPPTIDPHGFTHGPTESHGVWPWLNPVPNDVVQVVGALPRSPMRLIYTPVSGSLNASAVVPPIASGHGWSPGFAGSFNHWSPYTCPSGILLVAAENVAVLHPAPPTCP